jgi:hypothetical protein
MICCRFQVSAAGGPAGEVCVEDAEVFVVVQEIRKTWRKFSEKKGRQASIVLQVLFRAKVLEVNGLNEGFVLDFFVPRRETRREREREREIQWCKDFVSCLYSEEKTRPDQTRPKKRSVVKNTNGKIN